MYQICIKYMYVCIKYIDVCLYNKICILFLFNVYVFHDGGTILMISDGRQRRENLSLSFSWLKNQYILAAVAGRIFDLLDLINTLILHGDAARRVKERDWAAARCKSAFRKKETAKSNSPTVNLN